MEKITSFTFGDISRVALECRKCRSATVLTPAALKNFAEGPTTAETAGLHVAPQQSCPVCGADWWLDRQVNSDLRAYLVALAKVLNNPAQPVNVVPRFTVVTDTDD